MREIERLRSLADNILINKYARNAMRRIADNMEKELQERYMLLPVDRNGEPIHIGDVMYIDYNTGDTSLAKKVEGVAEDSIYVWQENLNGEGVIVCHTASKQRHLGEE